METGDMVGKAIREGSDLANLEVPPWQVGGEC